MDARGRRLVVVAHCLLNANTRVTGIARWEGVHTAVVTPYIERGLGIVQLPCPETSFLGMQRWAATRNQYDTPAFRRHCREVLRDTVETLAELAADGCAIEAVVGVPGSPSCGVLETSDGFVGGVPDGEQRSVRVPGMGVFMEEFAAMLSERGLDVPFGEGGDTNVTVP